MYTMPTFVGTYRTGTMIDRDRRVKIVDSTTSPPTIEYAGDDEVDIGTSYGYGMPADHLIGVRPKTDEGIHEMVLADNNAVAIGDQLYAATDGCVSTTVNPLYIGISKQSVPANNKFARFSVYRGV